MTDSRVLILGGCGFIGRNLVKYLIDNNLCTKVVIVDKTLPQLAWLNASHKAAFEDPRVEFRSANLINECAAAKGMEGDFEYVINLAAETRVGQFDQVYEEGIFKLSTTCARLAVRPSLKRFIELSTAMSSGDVPADENCKVDPWSAVGRNKARVEEELGKIEGLQYTILRLPVVYGVGDRNGLTPRLVIAAVYKHLKTTMKLLWTKDLRVNTVHVDDVCGAIWFLATRSDTVSQVVNVVDDSRSTQGSITEFLCKIFNIEVDYLGSILSKFAKIDVTAAVKEINEEHLQPWAKLCTVNGIENTPLTPYIDAELLTEHHISVNNKKLKTFGYTLKHPKITKELIETVIDDYVEQNLFPRV